MAVIVRRKQPFIDWIKYHDPEYDAVDEKHDEKSVYLLSEKDGDDWDKYVKKHFLDIFENELEGWYTGPEMWPADRSWKVFNEWIDFEVQTMVYDLVDSPVEKD
ncbi:MAG: hypothetical protein V2A70_00825 [Candidatus Omnitrophota bacterium]